MALLMYFVQNSEATEMGINDDIMREASLAAWEDPLRAFLIWQSDGSLLKCDGGDLGRRLFEAIDARS
jgi:hypothetical protein